MKLRTLSDDAMAKLARMYHQLRLEVRTLAGQLRALRNQGNIGPKPFGHFQLTEALTTSMNSASATLTAQYGRGRRHLNTTITVLNCATSTPNTYVFEGASGAAGPCGHHDGQTWVILTMECPTT